MQANAIKKISIERGYDTSEYVLGCFGGAGGQHACLVADSLGITQIFCHQFAGVLSAFGMGLADVSANRQRAIEAPLEASLLATLDTGQPAFPLYTPPLCKIYTVEIYRILQGRVCIYDGTRWG
jgi:5-oxoprolinase (ATP-hydrolysing)